MITKAREILLEEKLKNDQDIKNFIVECYKSHELIDTPTSDMFVLENKLEKKFKLENFSNSQKKILVIEFEIKDEQKALEYMLNYLRTELGFTEERIEKNRTGNKEQGHSYILNVLKDHLRRKHAYDARLSEYPMGPDKGKKRIFHSPATLKGCNALGSFLKDFQDSGFKKDEKCFDFSQINGIEDFKKLNFPNDKYTIMNSSWQAALGKRKNSDIDVLVDESFLKESLSLAKKPVSIMKYVHWYAEQATGITRPSEFIKKHSVLVDGIRIVSFQTYLDMMNVRKKSNTRFRDPAIVDLEAVKEFKSKNGLPVLK